MRQGAISRPAEILLVEDSPTDVLITREAFAQANLLINLHVVEDGIEAMAFLWKTGQYGDAPRPDLILLDWNLPRKNGREVLAEIKAAAALKSIPVIVLTSSQSERDLLTAYRLHANCHIIKPVNFKDFTQVIRDIGHFWLTVVTLPSH
ncbi:MAG TPA: response regulator [Alphaproteobacteria bacterium]|nr:response regulator [Alphaproteobacteria bacterium]